MADELSALDWTARAFAAGHTILVHKWTDDVCDLVGYRGDRGGESGLKGPPDSMLEWSATYTIEDAKQAKLINRQSWREHPRQMLYARASMMLCKIMCPDVMLTEGVLERPPEEYDGDGYTDASQTERSEHEQDLIDRYNVLPVQWQETVIAKLRGDNEDLRFAGFPHLIAAGPTWVDFAEYLLDHAERKSLDGELPGSPVSGTDGPESVRPSGPSPSPYGPTLTEIIYGEQPDSDAQGELSEPTGGGHSTDPSNADEWSPPAKPVVDWAVATLRKYIDVHGLEQPDPGKDWRLRAIAVVTKHLADNAPLDPEEPF